MSSKSISAAENLLDELQTALAHGTVARRVETLRRVTDLFICGAADYSCEQIEVFDDVFLCLIYQIETSARALLANRLAPIDTAPPLTVRALALDGHIEVAAPVLSRSARLDDNMLIETARNNSQSHLRAIAARRSLSVAVTDVLVLRGNEEVVENTVKNPGAEFSEFGFDRLVDRAAGNDELATHLGLRPTMPRYLFLKLIAKASATVRARLRAALPEYANEIPTTVHQATEQARAAPAEIDRDTETAHALVKALHDDGRLDEFQVAAFAEAGRFNEANAAIAALARVAVSTAESVMVESRNEGVMVLAKVAGMSWSTVKAIIDMRDALSGEGPTDLAGCRATYERLRLSTAQQVLRFHHMRRTVTPVPAT